MIILSIVLAIVALLRAFFLTSVTIFLPNIYVMSLERILHNSRRDKVIGKDNLVNFMI